MATTTRTMIAIHWMRLPVPSSGVKTAARTHAATSSRPKIVGTTTVSQCGCRSRSTFSPLASTFSGTPTVILLSSGPLGPRVPTQPRRSRLPVGRVGLREQPQTVGPGPARGLAEELGAEVDEVGSDEADEPLGLNLVQHLPVVDDELEDATVGLELPRVAAEHVDEGQADLVDAAEAEHDDGVLRPLVDAW